MVAGSLFWQREGDDMEGPRSRQKNCAEGSTRLLSCELVQLHAWGVSGATLLAKVLLVVARVRPDY